MTRHHILILGGTTESRQLATALADRTDVEVTLTLAGRTAAPLAQPVPVRIGGFGGAAGLAAYISQNSIDLLIDATHPFAARISANAAQAAALSRVPLFALRRPEWVQQAGDRWTLVDSVAEAVEILGKPPKTVFLAIGRQEAPLFEAAPQHRYIVRSVDPVVPALALPDVQTILATGPFEDDAEIDLLRDCQVDVLVAKNSGGTATYGKIAAARTLGIAVIMVGRQRPADVASVATIQDALDRIDHLLSPKMKRGV